MSRKGFFITIPTRALNDLSHAEFKVLGCICSYLGETNQCWPSYTKLAERAQMNKRNLIQYVKNLEEKGYIVIQERFSKNKGSLSNIISVVFDDGKRLKPEEIPEDEDSEEEEDLPGGGCYSETLGGGNDYHGGGVTHYHPNRSKPIEVNQLEDIPPIVPQGGSAPKKQISKHLKILKEMVDTWNEAASNSGLPRVQQITDQRKRAAARIVKVLESLGGMEGWQILLEKIGASQFLTEQFRPGFDWVVSSDHYVKIMEGNYDNQQPKSSTNKLKEVFKKRFERINMQEASR